MLLSGISSMSDPGSIIAYDTLNSCALSLEKCEGVANSHAIDLYVEALEMRGEPLLSSIDTDNLDIFLKDNGFTLDSYIPFTDAERKLGVKKLNPQKDSTIFAQMNFVLAHKD